MAQDGFIVLWRKMQDSWLWQLSPSDFKIAMTCILKANWSDGKWFDGKEMIDVPRGTFISSISKLAELSGTGVTVKMVRGCLRRLDAATFLKLGTMQGKRYSVVTIVNYETYQTPLETKGTTLGKVRAKSGQSQGKVRATIEQRNKGTREQERSMSEVKTSDESLPERPAPMKPQPPEMALRSAAFLRNHIVRIDPSHKLAKSFSEAKQVSWARTIDQAHRLDGRSWEDIKLVVEWLHRVPVGSPQNGGFVVFGADSLRKKFDNIRSKMKLEAPALRMPPKNKAPAPTDRAEGAGQTNEEWEAAMAAKLEAQA